MQNSSHRYNLLNTCADITDLVAQRHYKPRIPIETGVANFVEWHRDLFIKGP